MRPMLWAVSIAACLFAAHPGLTQDVNLQSLDGSIEISGSLIGFDGEFYRVDSIYGPLTVSAEGVRCDGPGCPDLQSFTAEIAIAAPMLLSEALVPALIQAFARQEGMDVARLVEASGRSILSLMREDGSIAAQFTLAAGSSSDSFLAFLNGDATLALTLREPLTMEIRAAEALGSDGPSLANRARILGLDALVPIVSRSNPAAQLSLPQIAQIFSGEITAWDQLGGPDMPIALHLPQAETDLAQAFSARVLVASGRALAADIVRHNDLRDLVDAVARDPFALGIAPYSNLGPARALAISGACGFAQEATADSLKAEDYPLTAPLLAYVAPGRQPRILRDFLRFLESAVAERVIRRAGFVSQSIVETGLDDQGRRLSNAILAAGDEISLADLQRLTERLAGAVRLSSTFRFGDGATELDIASRSAASRLARAIEQGDFDGRQLVFVGFSDGQGEAAVNQRIALRRAEAVRRAVVEAVGGADPERVRLEVAAFGEAMPLACDDSDWGRAANRRVEVWLE